MGIKTNRYAVTRVPEFSEKPPHHMGIKTLNAQQAAAKQISEKPPHHMGIKTHCFALFICFLKTLKNLPTTWGLRRSFFQVGFQLF